MIAARLASAKKSSRRLLQPVSFDAFGSSFQTAGRHTVIPDMFALTDRSVLPDIFVLPDKRQNLAAYLKLSRLLIGNNALVGGNDGDSQAAKYFGKLFLAGIYAKTGLGNSLQSGDDLVILVFAVLQSDVDGLERTVIQNVVFLNISLVQENTVSCFAVLALRILVSISAIGSLIVIRIASLFFLYQNSAFPVPGRRRACTSGTSLPFQNAASLLRAALTSLPS